MNQKSRYAPLKKKISVSYTLRDQSEQRNRSGINRLRVDPTSRYLFSAGRDSIIRLWDLQQYNESGEPVYLNSLEHHTDWVNDLVITKDGNTVMSASSDTSLKIWSVSRKVCTSTLKPHKDYVQALAYSPATESVISAGLDHNLYLWDIASLTQLTASKNTVTTIPLRGQKESVYSVDINTQGTVAVSGSTEKALRVWDTRTYQKTMKLKGHTDNVKAVLLNKDGTECVSGSSDGTVRLWSLGQQRCIETFRMHESGVWSLAVDESFRYLYSSGKDRRVYITDMTEGGQEGVLLFTEDHPVLSLALDPTDDEQSLWVSTTSSTIKRWPASPKVPPCNMDTDCSPPPLEDDPGVTDVDDLSFSHDKPISVIEGESIIVECRVLNNRRQVLTKDSKKNVALWDVLHACKECDLGPVDIDIEANERQEELYVPNWFSCDIKTGMLSIHLVESDCFSAWVMGDHTKLETATSDLKLNYGALMLKALFDHWPESYSYKERERIANTEVFLPMNLFMSVAEEVEDMNSFGITLGLPGNVMSGIMESSSDKEQIAKDLFQVLSSDTDNSLTMEKFIKSLKVMKMPSMVDRMIEEQDKLQTEACQVNKVDVQFFSVPDHTPVVLAESSDCGATVARFLSAEARNNHESTIINTAAPSWVTDIVVQNHLPTHPKVSFTIAKCDANGKELSSKPDRLSAQDILTVKKVMEYLYSKVYGEDGLMDESGEKIDCTECFEVFCNNQLVSPILDLRTVKLSIWKSGGDMCLFYKAKEPLQTSCEEKT